MTITLLRFPRPQPRRHLDRGPFHQRLELAQTQSFRNSSQIVPEVRHPLVRRILEL